MTKCFAPTNQNTSVVVASTAKVETKTAAARYLWYSNPASRSSTHEQNVPVMAILQAIGVSARLCPMSAWTLHPPAVLPAAMRDGRTRSSDQAHLRKKVKTLDIKAVQKHTVSGLFPGRRLWIAPGFSFFLIVLWYAAAEDWGSIISISVIVIFPLLFMIGYYSDFSLMFFFLLYSFLFPLLLVCLLFSFRFILSSSSFFSFSFFHPFGEKQQPQERERERERERR